MTAEERYALFCELIDSFDMGCRYVDEYNSLLHDYNGVVLYQAESQFIHKIGQEPGITITELAVYFDKTRSACSQLMRRMKDKGWLYQERNTDNNREYNLYLTEEGQKIYNYHLKFEEACYRRTMRMLDSFTEEELEIYVRIQKKLNDSCKLDVEESRKLQVNSSRS